MRHILPVVLLLSAAGSAAQGQTYYETTASARHGNGYVPATIVAGWEKETSFAVIAISRDGARQAPGDVASDWKAVVTIGPRTIADDRDDEEDERYLDRRATAPARAPAPAGPPEARQKAGYASLTCPALMARIEALKPLTTFEFNPPELAGNQDGPNGDGRQGLDLWVRIGGGELIKSAEAANSMLGRWFQETQATLAACPATLNPP